MVSEEGLYRQALEAIQQGKRARARELLTRLLRGNKDNPDYWLWLSAVVESDKERLYCLQTALRLDPESAAARRGLQLLGHTSMDEDIEPVPPPFRQWEVILRERKPSQVTARRLSPTLQRGLAAAAVILLVGLVFLGVFGTRSGLFGPRLTITPIAWTPTFTDTPSATPKGRTATPTPPDVVQPLWMSLRATYTPRPAYVATQHPRSEAFRIAMRAYANGDYERMLEFMQQLQREEPEAPDIQYYTGEAHRLLGEFDAAQEAYESAMAIDPTFAPAYLGRALAAYAAGAKASKSVEADFLKAIELDPAYAEAYMELARYYLEIGEQAAALDILEQGGGLLSAYPAYYRIQAQAALDRGEFEQAWELAAQAYEMDITALPVYLLLAETSLRLGQLEQALSYLQTYGAYDEENARYWALLGEVYYRLGEDFQAAFDAADRALELAEGIPSAYQYRGLAALELGDARAAVNDLFNARNLDPENFAINLGFSRAMWENGDVENAYLQINRSEKLAQTDAELAQVYYYRAQIAAELSQLQREELDWKALLELPEDVVPAEWRQQARQALGLVTVTPTLTATATGTTRTPTATPTATPTP